MRKIYLALLMLLAFGLSASATKHWRYYSFERNSDDWRNATNGGSSFQYTDYTHVTYLNGYAGGQGDWKTEHIVKGYDNRFAFHTWRWAWKTNVTQNYDGDDNQYLKNNAWNVNIFSVLNLRAGDIVRIRCLDYNNDWNLKNRFITAHSPNAVDNRPWTLWGSDAPNHPYNPAYGFGQQFNDATHEFIMQEDGNLDLNCAQQMQLKSVEIISPFVEYNKGVTDKTAKVGTPITTPQFQLNPNNEDHDANHDGAVWMEWQQPVVMYRGDIDGSNATVSYNKNGNQGQVTVSGFTGKGGSVVIMIERYMYVYTIPYEVADGSKSWNFWSSPLAVGRSTEKGPETLSLQAHDDAYGITKREWNHGTNSGNVYLTMYKDWMNGQNAYLNEETAGLIFWTEGDNNRRTYGYENETTVGDGGGYRYLSILKNGGFTIPNLKAGDQVYIYMGHMDNVTLNNGSKKAGVKFKVWNALDALKVPICDKQNATANDAKNDGGTIATGGSIWGPWISSGKWGRQYYGALHFYAATDGDMRFLMDGDEDRDYVKLYYIQIYKNEQDIITMTDDMVSNKGGYEILVRQKANGEFEPTDEHTLELRTTQVLGVNQRFEVLECSGNLTKDKVAGWCTAENRNWTTNSWIYKIQVKNITEPVHGAFLVRGKDFDHNNKYCMSYCDRVVAVGTLQQMNYPYTWDFKDILGRGESGSLFTADASQQDTHITGNKQTAYGDSTRIWTKNGDIYEINNSAYENSNRNWSSGAQLFARGEFIEEAAGVGFATFNQGGSNSAGSRNGDIAIMADGVRIMPQNQYGLTRVYVPNLKKGMRLYLQGKRYTGGKSGFNAFYLTGKANTPRVNNPGNTQRYHDNNGYDEDNKWSNNILLADRIKQVNIIKGDESEVKYDDFSYNFSILDIDKEVKRENIYVDNHLTLLADSISPENDHTMEIAQGSASAVDNSLKLYIKSRQEGNNIWVKDENGEETVAQYVDENGNIIKTGIVDGEGNLIYDSGNVTLAEDDGTYSTMLKTRGEASDAGRAIKISGLNAASSYTLTVVLKSGDNDVANELKIKGGNNWGSATELATMLARNNLMSKSIPVSGQETILLGSADGNIEIYAIYVTESHETTAVKATDFLAYIDMDEAEFYSQDATNVTLYLSDVLLERMAVTTDKKELNDIGWASESRDHYIDHRLNEVFNGVPVKAYIAIGTGTGTDGLINAINLTELTMPMELTEDQEARDGHTETWKGCILHNADEEGVENGIYLFVPAIHDYLDDTWITNAKFIGDAATNGCKISTGVKSSANANQTKINDMSDNMMVANVSGHIVPYSDINDPYTFYVLSYKYKDVNGVQHPTADETPEERFVRVGQGGATGKANTAFLRLNTTDVKPENWKGLASNLIILFDGEENNNPDGISNIDFFTTQGESENDTYDYYTLSGQKVNKPNKPGIYVRNGKKVYVK